MAEVPRESDGPHPFVAARDFQDRIVRPIGTSIVDDNQLRRESVPSRVAQRHRWSSAMHASSFWTGTTTDTGTSITSAYKQRRRTHTLGGGSDSTACWPDGQLREPQVYDT